MLPPTAPSIQFENLSVRYDRTPVIADLSLRIDPGSLVVLLGPSGSGKTTLLRTVNRMVTPTSGRVLVGGEDISTTDAVRLRRSIGYVMQASGLFPHRTVEDNIAVGPRLQGASRAAAREIAHKTLKRVGLDSSLRHRYPAQLSGGQQQRVGVARALAAEPLLLLMDEPFGAVDPVTRRILQRETLRLHRRSGATVLFVTHDVDEALALGDRIVVLGEGGRLAQDGTPGEILRAPADDFVAELLGVTAGDRALHIDREGGAEVVVDRAGRPVGVLEG